jgi:hypothetical protein
MVAKDPDTRFTQDNHGAILNQLFAAGTANPNQTDYKYVDGIRELHEKFKKISKKTFRDHYRTMSKKYKEYMGANNARRNLATAGVANRPPPAHVVHGLPANHVLPGFDAAPSLSQPMGLEGMYNCGHSRLGLTLTLTFLQLFLQGTYPTLVETKMTQASDTATTIPPPRVRACPWLLGVLTSVLLMVASMSRFSLFRLLA